MEGQIYIEREKDAEPRLIFTNRRAVEFLTGQVLDEYRTSSVPRTWLKEYRRSGREIAGRQ